MCGIAGIIGRRGEEVIRVMTATLSHRGPDGEGYFNGTNASLGHRRLAVIDREGGVQPMYSADGRYALVYNGEIYNFKPLRHALKQKGHAFHTESDTEVLLQSYVEHGPACVNLLDGMFAFAVYDTRDGTCFLARDPLGIKPLYYAEREGCLYFASEMKALLAVPGMPRDMDLESLDDYLAFLHTVPPRTIYQAIRQLPPGHHAQWGGGKLEVSRYWHVDCVPETHSEEEWAGELLARLDATVREHLVSDVPLGAYLSGGLDSASIVSAMCRPDCGNVRTFTIGFSREGRRYDERYPARALARHFNTEHNELIAHADAGQLLSTIVGCFDEPFGNPTALLSYMIAEQVRRHVTVILSGDGGDELFGGYPRYAGMLLSERYNRLPAWLRLRVLHPLIQRLPENTSGLHALRRLRSFSAGCLLPQVERYASWVSHFTQEERQALLQWDVRRELTERDAFAHIRAYAGECADSDPATRAMYIDLHTFLPNNVLQYGDRMSMAHGLETRVPFADARLTAWAMKMPGPLKVRGLTGKYILRRAMAQRLPEEILTASKRGFNPPMGVWLNTALRPMVEEYLSVETLTRRGYFQPEFVQGMIAAHRSGRRDFTWHLWALLVFEEWHRQYLD